MVFLRPWNPREWAESEKFVCVRDLADRSWIISEAESLGMAPREYFNSGLFVINRTRHSTMLRLAAKLCGRIRSNFYDQTQLNAARAWLDIPTHYLPKAYNYLLTAGDGCPPTDTIVGLHLLELDEKPAQSQLRHHQYWQPEPISDSPALREARQRLLASAHVYERVGHDRRRIRLGDGGLLVEGAMSCETDWRLTEEESRPVLWLTNGHLPICALEEDGQGIWQGRWLRWEQMHIRLIPAL